MGNAILSGKGRRWVLGGHPWIYRDDIVGGEAEPGELIPVEDPNGGRMGWGLYSSSSKIAIRLVTRQNQQPKREFWLERVQRAVEHRRRLGYLAEDGACRLIAGDSDSLPGWVVDLYGTVAVVQSTIQGADRMRHFLTELLVEALPFELTGILDRSDAPIRRFEEMAPRVEVLAGEVPEEIVVREGELHFEVDVRGGHKSGHYLDQRLNRQVAAERASGGRVLDAFSYDGLFGIRAAMSGAKEVLCVDQSKAAGERLLRNAERNGVADRVRFEKRNCMQDLRNRADAEERYEMVVVDPPAFARNRREVAGAERGYVELNRRALALVEEGGTLVSASCSYNVRPTDFVGFLTSAARLAGRATFLEEFRSASPDHPALLSLPESAYLKCAFLRVQ